MRQFIHRRDSSVTRDSDEDSWSSSEEEDSEVILIRGRGGVRSMETRGIAGSESTIGSTSNDTISASSQTDVSRVLLSPTFVEIGESVPEPEPEPDFSEFMWMENAEEFDRQVLAELELRASLGADYVPLSDGSEDDLMMREHGGDGFLVLDAAGLTLSTLQNIAATATTVTTGTNTGLTENLEAFAISLNHTPTSTTSSRLNPLAAEFIPSSLRNGFYRQSSSSNFSTSDDSDTDSGHPKISSDKHK